MAKEVGTMRADEDLSYTTTCTIKITASQVMTMSHEIWKWFCYVFCGYVDSSYRINVVYLSKLFRVASLALGQWDDRSSAGEVTLQYIDNIQ